MDVHRDGHERRKRVNFLAGVFIVNGSGTTTYTYGAAGNLLSRTDANNTKTTVAGYDSCHSPCPVVSVQCDRPPGLPARRQARGFSLAISASPRLRGEIEVALF